MRIVGVVTGATLAAWLPEQVLAQPGLTPHAGYGTWSPTGSMRTAREFHTTTRLKNGKVLAAGGSNPNALASAELYKP